MIYLALILSLTYATLLILLWYGWIKSDTLIKTKRDISGISVIIPFRNEEANLPGLIEALSNQQTIKDVKVEVIFVNDASTDKGQILVQQFIEEQKKYERIELINLEETNSLSPKKRALECGINKASGTWIICTDADCTPGPHWLQMWVDYVQNHDVKFVSGPVRFAGNKSVFSQLQQIEFSGLIGIGAASIKLGIPGMCNGANLGFEKEAFNAVNGYEGNRHIVSGDDEFLMHKIDKMFPHQVAFLAQEESIVSTPAHTSFRNFWEQRKRWASKSGNNSSFSEQLMAIFVWFYHLITLLALVAGVWDQQYLNYFIIMFGVKLGAETIFMLPVLRFLKQQQKAVLLPLLSFLYLPYVSIIAFASRKSFNWKKRSFHS